MQPPRARGQRRLQVQAEMFDSLSNNLQKVGRQLRRPPCSAFVVLSRYSPRLQAWSKLKSENELNANNVKEPLKEIRRALLVRLLQGHRPCTDVQLTFYCRTNFYFYHKKLASKARALASAFAVALFASRRI